MSDDVVKAKTGKAWKDWFAVLDRSGAAGLAHKQIAELLHETHKVPGWWAQTVTVEYERARGLRAKHETADGFSVGVSKTLAADAGALFEAVADTKLRKRWFPKGAFAVTSQSKGKSVRGKWKKDARLDFGFYDKVKGRAQIAVQISKLTDRDAVEAERAAWKAAFEKLSGLLR